ncbi:hypothetical protein QEH52_19715 [Coraliomargarita sp. SDUM461003]|uniref:Uncharacterized protein n=1 Tax=Thalassobacterium maritimum TaxID=3041265 RepID=A0ABU1B032_9BACT|nr:hypothetical protein [Coraliomargarita sp. SDUM461003]MDQ8209756.1 hypothetical protein [Coraliomargarita sp. SDUM461003]|tara:strand:- start:214 stop:528 length:315 start_codon:yes stop_codon:yes gene_type:complete
MNSDIIKEGRKLVCLLEKKSEEFHVKSDQHDILGYEAAILNARIDFVEKKKAMPENLRESTLLGSWGASYYSEEWQGLKNTVRAFYTKIPTEPETEPDGTGQPM